MSTKSKKSKKSKRSIDQFPCRKSAALSSLQKHSPTSFWKTAAALLSRPLQPRRTLAGGPAVMRAIFEASSMATKTAPLLIVTKLVAALPPPSHFLDSETHEMRVDPAYNLEGKSFRVHPGSLSKPLEVLDKAWRVGGVIDSTLIPAMGFGVKDLVELVLTHGDRILARTTPYFDQAFSQTELEQYWAEELSDSVLLCSNPEQAQKALDWATTKDTPHWAVDFLETSDYKDLRAILPTGETVDIPLFAYLDSLTCASRILADEAVRLEPRLESDFRKVIKEDVKNYLSHFGKVTIVGDKTFHVQLSKKRSVSVDLETQLSPGAFSGETLSVRAGADLIIYSTSFVGQTLIKQPSRGTAKALMVGSEYDLGVIAKTALRREDFHLMLEDFSKVEINPLNDLGELWSAWRLNGHLPLRGLSGFSVDPSTSDVWVHSESARQDPWLVHRSLDFRVQDRIADEAAVAKVSLTGADAAKFQRTVHAPAAKRVAAGLIGKYHRETLLQLGAEQLGLSAACRLERGGNVTLEHRRNERAATLALEMIVCQTNSSREMPDILDWQELLAAVLAWAEAEEDDMLSAKELKNLKITVDSLGNIERVSEPGLMDLRQYVTAREASPGEMRSLPPLRRKELLPALKCAYLPASAAWENAERSLEESLGFTVAELLYALIIMRNQEGGLYDRVDLQTGLIAEEVEPKKAAAILDFLILDGGILSTQGVEPWKVTERDQRLHVRPLIPLDAPGSEVILVPNWIALCILIIIAHLSEGRVPWSDNVCGKAALDHLNAYRNELAIELEEQVGAALARMGWPHSLNIKPPGGSVGIKGLKGEIDAIALDAEEKVLWVLEVKDPAQVFSAGRINEGVLRFTRPNAYYDKMKKKEELVRDNQELVLKSFGISPLGGWIVRSAVITRRPIPAAFFNPPVPFFTLLDLEANLRIHGADGAKAPSS